MGSDLIATIGERVAQRFAQDPALALAPPPVAMPTWRMQLLRLRRVRPDAGVSWLAGQVGHGEN
jgi:hypothetical protein